MPYGTKRLPLAQRINAFLANLFLTLCSMLFVLGALEFTARYLLMHTTDVHRFLTYASLDQLEQRHDFVSPQLRYQAHRYLGYYPSPNYDAEKLHNHHNSLGFRDDEIPVPKPAGEFRVVCLGGSATYTPCVGDYRYSYPKCVERELRQRGFTNVRVINAGADGWTSYETLISLEFRVLDLQPDLLLIMDGVNDTLARVVWPHDAYKGDNSGYRVPSKPFVPALYEYSTLIRGLLIKTGLLAPRSALISSYDTTCRDTFHGFKAEDQMQRGVYPSGVFAEANLAQMLAANPPDYFRRNLTNTIALARARGVGVILVTAAWSPHHEVKPGVRPLVSSPEFQAALEDCNALIKALGQEQKVPVYDLAAVFPKEDKFYQDGLHVNYEGVQIMGKVFADYLEHSALVPKPGTGAAQGTQAP